MQVVAAGASAIVCRSRTGHRDAAATALLARAIAERVPLVLDADALNAIAKDAALAAAVAQREAATLATPHPAEAARLLGTTTDAIQADRLAAAQALAAKLRAHVVVKGAGSVLAHPDGTWDINASGNAGLATAGSGDVLAGFAGAFLAQGIDARSALAPRGVPARRGGGRVRSQRPRPAGTHRVRAAARRAGLLNAR